MPLLTRMITNDTIMAVRKRILDDWGKGLIDWSVASTCLKYLQVVLKSLDQHPTG